jgi:predicted acyltransferase
MTIGFLDQIFPFFIFCYGILMIFVLENKALDRLARQRMPEWGATLRSHKPIAYLSLFVGGLWSLQNLLFP